MKCGFAEKDIIQKWVNGEEIPKPPQPKSPPPAPPKDLDNKGEVKEFSDNYAKWVKENQHLPNLLTIDQVMDRLKQSRERMAQQPQGQPGQPGVAGSPTPPQHAPMGGSSNFQPKYNKQIYYL